MSTSFKTVYAAFIRPVVLLSDGREVPGLEIFGESGERIQIVTSDKGVKELIKDLQTLLQKHPTKRLDDLHSVLKTSS